MRIALALIPLAALTACAGIPFRYTGTLTRTSGTCETTTANLVRRGNAISFAPNDGVLTLPGTVSADGTAQATLTTKGVNGKPYRMQLAGQLTDTTFKGHYHTPTCQADVALVAR